MDDRPPLVIVGNPENRRVRGFSETAVDAGWPPPVELSWLAIATDPDWTRPLESLGDEVVVRIESAGECFELDRELLALGHERARALGCELTPPETARAMEYDRGRLLSPRQQHEGFCVLLDRLEAALRPQWRVLTPIPAIRTLFDKRAMSREHEAAGVPVPPRIDVRDDVGQAMGDAGVERAFVKITCASSASGLAVVTRDSGGALSLLTTVELTPEGARYNTLRLARYRDPDQVRELLRYLLGEDAIVEAEVRKATLQGRPFDCRMLVVGDEVAFTVPRLGRSVITNLHLGGRRGDPQAYRETIPVEVRAAAEADCVRLAQHHGCFHLGCDVAFTADRGSHVVIEANAFGDLLPRLERDGLDVYGWQLSQL